MGKNIKDVGSIDVVFFDSDKADIGEIVELCTTGSITVDIHNDELLVTLTSLVYSNPDLHVSLRFHDSVSKDESEKYLEKYELHKRIGSMCIEHALNFIVTGLGLDGEWED